MTTPAVKEDIEWTLDGIKAEDGDFQYAIEMPPTAKYKVNPEVMEPFDQPMEEYILETVLRHYPGITGREPDGVGMVLQGSYSDDDTCQIWQVSSIVQW